MIRVRMILVLILVTCLISFVRGSTDQESTKLASLSAEGKTQPFQIHELIVRIENLEQREKQRDQENAALKLRVHFLETLTEQQQLDITYLKNSLTEQLNKRKEVTNIKKGETATRYRRENEVHVAFFAYLTNHLVNAGVHQIVAFDHVTTNIGNGYNPHAGDFRAPVAGTYVFSTTLMPDDNSIYHYQIMHNGHTVSSIYITNGGTSSMEVILELQQGDDVSIHNMDTSKKLYGAGYSSFSGFLLQQNYSSPGVVGK